MRADKNVTELLKNNWDKGGGHGGSILNDIRIGRNTTILPLREMLRKDYRTLDYVLIPDVFIHDNNQGEALFADIWLLTDQTNFEDADFAQIKTPRHH